MTKIQVQSLAITPNYQMATGLDTPFQPNKLVKFTSALAAGILVTFALFILMQFLIQASDEVPPPPKPTPSIDLVMQKPDTSVKQKIRPLPQPPKLVKPPEPLAQTTTMSEGISLKPVIDVPNLGYRVSGTDLTGAGKTDTNAKPIVRIEPSYPMAAARQGIEGWVELSFSIAADGSVTDVQVINAEPKRIFDSAAKKALKRWKYSPKLEQGRAKVQTGMNVRLDFSMN